MINPKTQFNIHDVVKTGLSNSPPSFPHFPSEFIELHYKTTHSRVFSCCRLVGLCKI
jgi:hypothetical protein